MTDTSNTRMTSTTNGSDNRINEYWQRNLKYVGVLLAIWFTVSYGAGILFVDFLNRIERAEAVRNVATEDA